MYFSRIRCSKTAEPDLSVKDASAMTVSKPIAPQIFWAEPQLNKRCRISSGELLQIGHYPLFPIWRLARIDSRGRIPCRALQMKILFLLGIFNRLTDFHTGFRAEDPGKAS
jgi:hypothetical protein